MLRNKRARTLRHKVYNTYIPLNYPWQFAYVGGYLVGLSSIYYISKDLHSTCKKFTFTTAETARQSCYRALN